MIYFLYNLRYIEIDSIFLTKQAYTTEFPFHWCCHSLVSVYTRLSSFCLQVASENEIFIISLWIFVNWAEVMSLCHCIKVHLWISLSWSSLGWRSNGHCRNHENWECSKENLWLRIFKLLFYFAPCGTFQV